MNRHVAPNHPTKFRDHTTYVSARTIYLDRTESPWFQEMSFDEFQDGWYGGQLGYRNGRILAIRNLYGALIPHIKVQLNPTYGSAGDVKCEKLTTDGRTDGQ